MLYHRYQHLFVGTVAVCKHHKHIGYVQCCIGFGPHDAYLFDASALSLLLTDEHLGIGNELFSIASGNAVGPIVPVYESGIIAFQQIFLIHLGSLRGHVTGRKSRRTSCQQAR